MYWSITGIQMIGFLRTENTLLVVMISFLAVRIVQNWKDSITLLIGVFLFVGGYTVIAFTYTRWLMFVMMFLLTVGEVIRVPVEQSYKAILPPKHARSSYLALSGMQIHFATIIASLTVTLDAYVSKPVVAGIIGLIGLASLCIFYFILPQLEKKKARVQDAA